MKRYDDDKKYKAVPHVPGHLDEFEERAWRAVCRKKLDTEEGLKGGDLEDVLGLVCKLKALEHVLSDFNYFSRQLKIRKLPEMGTTAQEIRDYNERLFGNPDGHLELNI